MNYNHRYIAQITIEAKSTFAVNSGKVGLLHDNVVSKDANGLPYIPGTSLAGIMRHAAVKNDIAEEIFGKGGNDGFGSRIQFSPGLMVGEEGKVVEGLKNLNFKDGFYSHFKQLPFRDHVKINDRGTAVDHAKFDEELVFKGTRFVFEIELVGNQDDKKSWEELLKLVNSPNFRIGAGTRKGHGDFSPVKEDSFQVIYNLSQEEDLEAYLTKSASLNQKLPKCSPIKFEEATFDNWERFSLRISPNDFFIFGAGYGDEEADRISKKEKFIQWKDGKPQLLEDDFILIPATSIKGALWHRVAFHYNSESGNVIGEPKNNQAPDRSFAIDKMLEYLEKLKRYKQINITSEDDVYESLIQEIENFTFEESEDWKDYLEYLEDEGEKISRTSSVSNDENLGVNELFGFAKDSENKISGKRGAVLLSDLYIPFHKDQEKVFNHVKIDRFTGGSLDGALFQEKAFHSTNPIEFDIWVEASVLSNSQIKKAFEDSLNDLISGNLPLGGMTTKGHGFFKGEKLEK